MHKEFQTFMLSPGQDLKIVLSVAFPQFVSGPKKRKKHIKIIFISLGSSAHKILSK